MTHNVIHFFRNLSISRKMLIGYLSLAAITVLLGIFAIYSLERINRLNSNIINVYAPILKTSESLSDAVLAQELYGRRHAILKTPQTLELFNAKCRESRELAEELGRLSNETSEIPNVPITPLLEKYTSLFQDNVAHLATPTSEKGKQLDELIRKTQELLLTDIHKVTSQAHKAQNLMISQSYQVSTTAFWITIILCLLVFLVGIFDATLVTRNISSSINTLMQATEHVAEGNFKDLPRVESEDEIGELSRAFGSMAERLRNLEEMYLDASPLTHLPGGVAIENVLKKRIASGAALAFCLVDMDNFKSYNDHYGYARGSELIQVLGRIVEERVRQLGNPTDFVGHVGGDDFVVITTPDKFKSICSSIIESFDQAVPEYYDPEDRERGHILGKTRQGEEITYPIVTISIAVVTNKARRITSHLQMGEIAGELKEYAKSLSGSLYVVDHRRRDN